MAVSTSHASFIARDFIATNDLQPSCEIDIIALAPKLSDDAEANKAVLDEWLETRNHVRKSPAAMADEKIDLALERTAFGPTASPGGRAKAYRVYSPELFEQRRVAWGASEGTIRSGTEPGKDSAAVVAQAEKIVADTNSDANSPFNPRKRYLTEQTRINDINKFINHYGTAAARAQCVKFGTDIAGRPLRKRA